MRKLKIHKTRANLQSADCAMLTVQSVELQILLQKPQSLPCCIIALYH